MARTAARLRLLDIQGSPQLHKLVAKAIESTHYNQREAQGLIEAITQWLCLTPDLEPGALLVAVKSDVTDMLEHLVRECRAEFMLLTFTLNGDVMGYSRDDKKCVNMETLVQEAHRTMRLLQEAHGSYLSPHLAAWGDMIGESKVDAPFVVYP